MIRVRPGYNGRLGNHVFRNLAAYCIAKRQGCSVQYSIDLSVLGLDLTSDVSECDGPVQSLSEEQAILYAQYSFPRQCLSVDDIYCQNPYFCHRIYRLIVSQKESIRRANPFRDEYHAREVFVHVRLDDATQWNPGYEYYRRALARANASGGFLSSDSPSHPLVLRLCEEFKLNPFTDTELRTFQFASTCKSVILSHGTFSWTIGVLADGQVFYPKLTPVWHGTIYECMPWIAI